MLAKISFYLDKRFLNKEGKCHVKIAIRRNGKSAYILTGIYVQPEKWTNNTVVGDKDARFLNMILAQKKAEVDKAYLELSTAGLCFQKSVPEIVELILERIDPDYALECQKKRDQEYNATHGFFARFSLFCNTKENPGTRGLYLATLSKVTDFCISNGDNVDNLRFDDIKSSWLEAFEKYCLKTERQNTVSIHLRNIRAVFNAAIDDDITTNYPFRKFKIKKEETVDKSYSAQELRTLFNYQCYPGGEQEAVDIFKLMFCLIGINSIDLANLTTQVKGRVEYRRAKTQKYYSIKVEPEAAEIIEKYRGEEHLVDILERCPNYKTYFNRLAKTLRKVGKERVDGKKSTGKAILPDVCTGSARTSWATIAQEELDIPRDIIAAALGHHTIDVTSTYLRTDWKKKVDEANRKVLNWVFYEKR